MSTPKIVVSLRISGDDLDPAEVTALFNCQPDRALRKGDEVRTGTFVRPSPTWIWLLKPKEPEVAAFDDRVKLLLNLVSSDVDIWRRLSQRFALELFVGVFLAEKNQGFNITAPTMQELGRRGIRLALDIYDATGGEKAAV